ncbi:GNAT family N-acetyltransferase [Nocardia huaxiensis]|uniref:GNAT family N-acetyltransferase n=1 Tax=Nocardia huaxiensis TaxID=2755382 RepID=A0A7D6VK11_9NOCA|nr:GNAT family N-acetyltransferase [Nocardia huaxiensis]QLY31636.1 GNAT family N-acetyltransferase [Nocardia huaxiensis]UFS95189.1 GNAT family N-acetyltransferase [Nocardia huaxiensis]
MEDAQTLSNGTLWLSPPTVHDIDAITARCQEPSIGEWTTMPVPYHRADAEKFVYDIVTPGWASRRPTWALRLAEHGPVIGMIGLGTPDLHRDSDAAEIGYWLSGAQRGRGLMTQAVRMVCTAGFDPLLFAFQRIEWRAFTGNHGSAAVVRRAGFRYEGLLRGGAVQRGVRRDSWVAGRLATDAADPAPDWPDSV